MSKHSFWMRLGSRVLQLIFAFVLLEACLWILGWRPYHHDAFEITSTPEFCLLPHASKAFVLHPGAFSVLLDHQVNYKATHNADSLRITREAGFQFSSESPREIQLHGCSFTYGWGVSDSLTFPWLLQHARPDLNVKNYGVPGYGTVQALQSLREQLQNGTAPDELVICYTPHHDVRNAFTPAWRTHLGRGFAASNPAVEQRFGTAGYPKLADGGGKCEIEIVPQSEWHRDWPLRNYSATVNGLQTMLEFTEEAQQKPLLSTEKVFAELHELCGKNGITFRVALLEQHANTQELIDWCRAENITVLDISAPLYSKDWRVFENDIHPNARAHRYYAEKLAAEL